MTPAYFDANYVFKLQVTEAGSAEVRALASSVSEIHSAAHTRADFASAAFRKVREGFATMDEFRRLLAQFKTDVSTTTVVLLPLVDPVYDRIEAAFATAPSTLYLRAADALHLATAAEHGFTEIYSNDRQLLAAASHFGIMGVNVIA
jgi:predicted nucleic acid-binding protein